MKQEKLNALIGLLDDPDNLVFETVQKELLKENESIIPVLEDRWESSFDESLQERIENLIQQLQFKNTKKQLMNWMKSGEKELLEGFLIIERLQYPEINILGLHQKIEKIRKLIWLEFNNSLTLLEKITILNHFLFHVNGFDIDLKNLNSLQDCFLNQILDTKKGNPVSMAAFYAIIARKLGIEAYFADFPKNPLVAIADYKLAQKVHGKKTNTPVLFYINPSNKGSITSRKEIDYHLKKNNYSPADYFAEPKNDLFFIQKILESLKDACRQAGLEEKEGKVTELLRLFETGLPQQINN